MYRDDDCEQANEDEQIEGKNNNVLGFNDQSKNIAQLCRHHHANRHPSGHKERHLR